jgi:hypothetical protein
LVNARPAKDHKKGADTGIDGYINFFDDKSGQAKQVIVQVKSGHIGVNHVRDLKGVIEREKAALGALITLREPTKPMLTEAASAGFYEPKEFPGRHPRLQILTIADTYAGEFPGSILQYNDQSLPWGGLFDIGPTQNCQNCVFWQTPHSSHRLGTDCDIDKSIVPVERRARVRQIIDDQADIPEEDGAHWHARF